MSEMTDNIRKIVKDNDLIQKTKYNLNIEEQKILAYIISMIEPNEQSLKEVEIKASDFLNMCGSNNLGGANYKYLRETIQNLKNKSFWLKKGHEWCLLSWIRRVYMDTEAGITKIELDPILEEYLVGLYTKFTTYELRIVMKLKSSYSFRMYELLKSYENIKCPLIYDVATLREYLGLEENKYAIYSEFKRNVLEVAVREINQKTDLNIQYQQIRHGRMIEKIQLTVSRKEEA